MKSKQTHPTYSYTNTHAHTFKDKPIASERISVEPGAKPARLLVHYEKGNRAGGFLGRHCRLHMGVQEMRRREMKRAREIGGNLYLDSNLDGFIQG